MTLPSELGRFVVVLMEPQRAINVGTAMRALKNMGLVALRLVSPAPMSLERTQIAAHRTEDLLEAIESYDSFEAAIADCHHVVGMTARPRRGGWMTSPPRARAHDLVTQARGGQRIALVFGRAASGLTNDELDRCDELITIPTRPDYSSLNLAQAVLLVCYELWLVAADEDSQSAVEAVEPPPDSSQRERLFAQIEHTLSGIRFFKSNSSVRVMRTLRRLIHRAQPSSREIRLLTGIFVETLKFAELVRRGVFTFDDVPLATVDLQSKAASYDQVAEEAPDDP